MFKEFVWSYMDEFVVELTAQLKSDQERWGDTWKKRIKGGQEERIYANIQNYFDQYFNGGYPIPWLKIAGLAMIAWIREYEQMKEQRTGEEVV